MTEWLGDHYWYNMTTLQTDVAYMHKIHLSTQIELSSIVENSVVADGLINKLRQDLFYRVAKALMERGDLIQEYFSMTTDSSIYRFDAIILSLDQFSEMERKIRNLERDLKMLQTASTDNKDAQP